MEIFTAHGSIEKVEELSLINRSVIFPSPNIMAVLQPLDAAIIAALKCRYRRRHIARALDLSELGQSNIYNLDQLHAMKWIRDSWNEIPSAVIYNCWRRTKLLQNREEKNDVASSVGNDEQELDLGAELSNWFLPQTHEGHYNFS